MFCYTCSYLYEGRRSLADLRHIPVGVVTRECDNKGLESKGGDAGKQAMK